MARISESTSYKFIFDLTSRHRMSSNGNGRVLSMVQDPMEQWDIGLILLSDEELRNVTPDSDRFEPHVMTNAMLNLGIQKFLLLWLRKMKAMYGGRITNEDTPRKNDEVAEYWRLKGNQDFETDFTEDSLKSYNNSVRYAVTGGSMYPLAMGNRSAAFYRLQKYKECLRDIDRALESGYPENMKHKLYLRRAKCYIQMNEKAEGEKHLQAAIDHAAQMNLKRGYAEDFESQVSWVRAMFEDAIAEDEDEKVSLPDLHLGPNENFVNASKSVTIKYNEEFGRHVVTTEPVQRGDVLFSEEPYAWVTINPEKDNLCEQCCNRNNIANFVPCVTCSRVVFCSEECRDKGMDLFHRWECVGVQSRIFQTIGISHLSLRVLFTAAKEGFPALPPGFPKPCTAHEVFYGYTRVDPIDIYKSGYHRFYRMFNLHTNIQKIDQRDYWQYVVTAYALLLYLERFTTFFDYLPARLPYHLPGSQLRLFVASLLLRSICQLICNGHATTGILITPDASDTQAEQESRRATAIYLSSAMMNHSCNPNIINTFFGNRLIIRCARELAVGAEVLNCYGPHRARKATRSRRESLLGQYGFLCNCPDCKNPENDIVALYNAYACQSCKNPALWDGTTTRCIQCRTEFPLERASRLIDRAETLELKGAREPTLAHQAEMEFQALRLRQQVLHRHNSQLRISMDRLAQMCAALKDYNRSIELIKHNVQTLECQYGSFSAEVAHELRKLSGVMVVRLKQAEDSPEFREWCLETYKVVKKAYQLSELNFGGWQPIVKELRQREKYVASIVAQQRAADAADDLENVHHNLHYNLKI